MRRETAEAVERLLAETGHALAVADCDAIAALDRLAGDVATDTEDLDLKPVYVGGVQVQPMTLYRAAWLEWAQEWAGDDEAIGAAALGLALTAKSHAELEAIHDADTLKRAAVRWLRSIPWTPGQYRRAVELRMDARGEADDTTGAPGKREGVGGIVAFLSAEYGATPDYWMYEADAAMISSLIGEWIKRQEAQAAALRRANKGKGGVAPVATPKFRAARLFREGVDKLRAQWQRER